MGAAESVAEEKGDARPLRSDSHVLCWWGGRAKWDRKKKNTKITEPSK